MSKKNKTIFKKIWYFIWEDDSALSWIVNLVLAFILIKYIIFPGLGLLLGTTHPVVAVVSGSMEHKTTPVCTKYVTNSKGEIYCADYGTRYEICGHDFETKQKVNFDFFWDTCGEFYDEYNISKEEFGNYIFKNGFNTGDIIVLLGRKPSKLKPGDVIVFQASHRPDPIIHRLVGTKSINDEYFFTTKGDHNGNTHSFETEIHQDKVIGRALFRIPYLGYIKIWFVDLLKMLGMTRLLSLFN